MTLQQADLDLESRIARLEEAVRNVANDVSELARVLGTFRQTPWSNIWAGLTVLLLILGASATALISPIYVQLNAHKERQDFQEIAFKERIESQENAHEALMQLVLESRTKIEKSEQDSAVALVEAKTKALWLNDVVNLRAKQQEDLIALLWDKVYDKPMPRGPSSDSGPSSIADDAK